MKRKAIISIIISFAIITFSFSCFASNEIVGGVTGNVLDKTENVAKDVVNGVSGAAESVVNGVTNVAGDIGNGVREGAEDVADYAVDNEAENIPDYAVPDNALRTNTSDEYNATMANTMSGNTFLGLDSTAWWWIIIGAICVLLIILFWNRMNNDRDS